MSNANEALEKCVNVYFILTLQCMLINDIFENVKMLTYFDSLFVSIRLTSHSMYNCLHERYLEQYTRLRTTNADGIN